VIWNGAEISKQEDSMKNALCRITVILALALLATTHVALAQQPLLASIPFQFTAGQMTLPAGEYRVLKTDEASPFLLIQRTDGGAATYVISNAVQVNNPQTQSKLVFHRIGQRYFLSQIWVAGYSRGRQLPPSAKEKEQALLARNEASEQVTIVARLMASDH
jgi:hypothetical protein